MGYRQTKQTLRDSVRFWAASLSRDKVEVIQTPPSWWYWPVLVVMEQRGFASFRSKGSKSIEKSRLRSEFKFRGSLDHGGPMRESLG